ncbi:uncharacterized protein LOC117702235 [Arvicanthis niloticus]|uniref:uncharacterized protein LOC117702235 n=1 Tax=Arvicanthis niloticus TaxID=61156 RepID=UPI00402BAC3F
MAAPPPRSASDVSPAAPRPRRSARMRVTCGRHLPVPGSQRQSEPARAAAAAVTAFAKSSAATPPCRLPLPPSRLPPRPARVAPLHLLQILPVTGDCSRPRPRWMRWWTS